MRLRKSKKYESGKIMLILRLLILGILVMTYCLCEDEEYGKMVACDNTFCGVKWFHFDCVGLTTEPKGEWLCPNCR